MAGVREEGSCRFERPALARVRASVGEERRAARVLRAERTVRRGEPGGARYEPGVRAERNASGGQRRCLWNPPPLKKAGETLSVCFTLALC